MSSRKRIKRLPDSELEIMMILWGADGTVTSAYVCEQLKDKQEWKVTSVLTFLARLVEKGFVSSTRQGKANIYTAVISEQEYLESESKSFLEKLYGNSLTTLVSALYKSNAINDDDLAELQQFIDETTGGA
jgi:predicted transcriptional regulator